MEDPAPAAPTGIDARERLLRAAERLFAEKGYAATAVHEITDAAGANRALLYYYFADKRSLYEAVIDAGLAEFMEMLDDALAAPGTYSDRLAGFVRGHLDLIWRRGDMTRIVHRCLLDGQQQEVGLVEKFRVSVDRLEAFFREAAAAGEFRVVDPAITARTIIGPTFVFSLWRLSEDVPFSQEQLAATITDQLLRGLRVS